MKRVPVCDILSTLFRVCFSILCSNIGTKLTWKRPPRGWGDGGGRTSEIRDAESGADIKISKQYTCVKTTTQRKTSWTEVTQQTG